MASIFGLNAKELNAGNLPLGIVFAYICTSLLNSPPHKPMPQSLTRPVPISVFIIVVSFVLAFTDAAREIVIAPFTKRRKAHKKAKRQRLAADTTGSPPDYTAIYTDPAPELASAETSTSRRRPWRWSPREPTTSAV